MIRVSAPGKLFIAGEWSVLSLGNPGIVAAVNKRVFAELEDSEDEFVHLSIRDFNIGDMKASRTGKSLHFVRELNEQEIRDTLFAKSAIEAVMAYQGDLKPVKITTWGEETTVRTPEGVRKVGFGSSAASVVAIVSALLKHSGHDIERPESKEIIYKLSAIAHYIAQGKVGSAFDVAASTYGGVFIYKRFDPEWLSYRLENGSVREAVKSEWPGFMVEPLGIPEGMDLIVGWTKKSASTSPMVKRINEWRGSDPEGKKIFDRISLLVNDLISAWKSANKEKIMDCLRKNEEYLRELTQKSGVEIETPKLRELSEIANRNGGAGKLSGAGGGDCGIAVSFDPGVTAKIRNEWENNGISPIDADIYPYGVKMHA